MFEVGDIVEHMKGGKYVILRLPRMDRLLEHNKKPYYEYKGLKIGITWIREQEEFEDGRFKLIQCVNTE